MVQRTFNVRLSLYASRKLTAMVEGKSKSAEEVAAIMLESHLFDYDDFTWVNGDPRDDHAASHDMDELGRLWSEVRPEFLALIEQTFGPKDKASRTGDDDGPYVELDDALDTFDTETRSTHSADTG